MIVDYENVRYAQLHITFNYITNTPVTPTIRQTINICRNNNTLSNELTDPFSTTNV